MLDNNSYAVCDNVAVNNIISVYNLSTAIERADGREWYRTAFRHATAIANEYNCEFEAVVGVIAALSPNVRWSTNVQAAEDLVKAYVFDVDIEAVRLPCYRANVKKAWAIINGMPVLDVLRGNKVRAFFENIMGLNHTTVCVDAHAYAVWLNQRVTTKSVGKISDKLYKQISDDYIEAARQLQLEPRVLQATTWVTWRRLHGIG
jgi:hypothetical protein